MAVELLVRLNAGANGRDKGDIIYAKQVPHRGWGRREGPPNYTIIRIEDKDLADVQSMVKPHQKLAKKTKAKGKRAIKDDRIRSRFKINVDSLPPVDRTAIANKHKVISNWSVISSRMVDYKVIAEAKEKFRSSYDKDNNFHLK